MPVGNPRTLTVMADTLLAGAAELDREVLDEKLFFDTWGETPKAHESAPVSALPTRAPAELEDRPRHQHWLIDTLWGREAVGIIGGEPKCCFARNFVTDFSVCF